MKNAKSIYYLIGITVVIIVVNTVFFLLQSSQNKKKYAASRQTYETIETTHLLLDKTKDAETAQKEYALSRDTAYLTSYQKAKERISDLYRSLYSSLSTDSRQRYNLRQLNELLKLQLNEPNTSSVRNKENQIAAEPDPETMKKIKAMVAKITKIEKDKLAGNNLSIERSTRKTQVFSVVSNWVLLVIVISGLISIVQNRHKLSELFEEVEKKNEILESQKNELQGLSQDLIKQNHELERFAYVASHDLRSPGVNLIALLHLYEDATNEQEKASLMEIIKEVADNLIVKLDDLIEMLRSKHESSAVNEKLIFKQVYKNVIKNLSGDIKKSNAHLHYDFSEAPTLNYPKTYLESIIQNLVSNAIKYRNPKKAPQIWIKTYQKDETTYMEVKDNGLGIDLKKHGDNMFGIYQTFHANSNSKGVGLYITKAQVVAMGGNIEVESIPDEGTTFKINFFSSDRTPR